MLLRLDPRRAGHSRAPPNSLVGHPHPLLITPGYPIPKISLPFRRLPAGGGQAAKRKIPVV